MINREEEEEGRKTLVMNFLGGFLSVYVMEIGVLVRVCGLFNNCILSFIQGPLLPIYPPYQFFIFFWLFHFGLHIVIRLI